VAIELEGLAGRGILGSSRKRDLMETADRLVRIADVLVLEARANNPRTVGLASQIGGVGLAATVGFFSAFGGGVAADLVPLQQAHQTALTCLVKVDGQVETAEKHIDDEIKQAILAQGAVLDGIASSIDTGDSMRRSDYDSLAQRARESLEQPLEAAEAFEAAGLVLRRQIDDRYPGNINEAAKDALLSRVSDVEDSLRDLREQLRLQSLGN
jgi:hypothetical protein